MHGIGIMLMLVGVLEVVTLSLIGLFKHKPILILAGALSGVVTSLLGVAFYLDKIPLR
jgi:hypothetical protein